MSPSTRVRDCAKTRSANPGRPPGARTDPERFNLPSTTGPRGGPSHEGRRAPPPGRVEGGPRILAEVGPIPVGAAVGHRPRGLQRLRRRVELLQPRPGALARLPLGRGRARRDLRRQAAPVLRAGPVERPGPHPQGAALRADQQRGQPRRGREGVLLLPRLDAHPLVHEVPVQVPAGLVSLRRPHRDQRTPQPGRARVRAARHRRLRRGPLLRRVRGVRQGGAGRHPGPDHRREPRSRAGHASRAADALVPQHVVVGGRGAAPEPPAGRARADRGRPSGPRRALPRPARARPRSSSPRTRPTPSGSSGRPTAPRT